MKVRYIGVTKKYYLTHGKVYEVLSIEKDWYRIIDDAGDNCLYPPEIFEIVK